MAVNELDFDFNADDFSDFEIDLDSEFETRYVKPPRSRSIQEHCLKYSDAVKLAKDIRIDKGSRYFVVISGTFYFGDFIEALLVEHNILVKKMTISTLSMNENNVDSLANLLNGGFVKELNLIVSDYFYSHERSDLIPYIYQELDKGDRFQLAVARTHCKLCIFETAKGAKVVIHGSANLRSSDNIEQFVIEESPALYDFNDEYQSKIIEHFKTIEKPIGGNKLWQKVAGTAQPEAAKGPKEEPKPAKAKRQPPK